MTDLVEITAREELYELASQLQEADTKEKTWKGRKEKIRKPFFELITEVVAEEAPLAKVSETVVLAGLVGDSIEEKVERYRLAEYPEYLLLRYEVLDSADVVSDGQVGLLVSVELQEDPAVRKFSFVHDGFKFGRTYSMVGGGTDVKGLFETLSMATKSADIDQAARIALKNAITPKQITIYELDEEAVRQALIDYPELVTVVQQFIDPGKPQVKLTPITKDRGEQ